MSWMRGLSQRMRAVFQFSSVESELDRELRDHIEREVQRQVNAGLSPEDARQEAARRVGNLEAIKEDVRDERGGRAITDAMSDLRIGWRGLRRNPGFTVAVVLSLALGTAGTTAMFSVVQAVLLRPLSYPDGDRLHLVRVAWNEFTANLSVADFLRIREQGGAVADVGAFYLPNNGFTMVTDGGPEVVQGANMTADLPRVLGVAPVIGRLFSDNRGAREALIGTEFWRQRFGGMVSVLGQSITLDGVAYPIVGVMPPGYGVPSQTDGEVWVRVDVNEPTRRGPFTWRVLARLHPGVSGTVAATRLTAAVMPVLRERYPQADSAWRYRVLPMKDVLVGDLRTTLLLLFGAVCLVMVIAVGNVANLLLARGTARARELAVRASLGAGRGRLVRQLLTESALLGALGSALGLAIALGLLRIAHSMAARLVPRLNEVRFDPFVIVFGLSIGICAALLAGVLPVFWLTRSRLSDALRDGGRGAGESVRRGRIRRVLVAAEIALTLTVLCGAALLVKSLVRLQTVDPGFRPPGVLSFRLSLPDDPYDDNARLHAFLDTLEGRLRGLPGVSSVGYVTSLPPDRLQWEDNYAIEGDRSNTGVAPLINATPDYFQTLGIPLMRGRGFKAADGFNAAPVAVVSEAFARQHFPDGQAVGRRFKRGGWDSRDAWRTIVGVVGDVPYEAGVWGGTRPTIYLPNAQNPGIQSPYVILRTAGNPTLLVSAAREAVQRLDSRVPLRDVATMEERMHASTAAPRFRSLLFSLLAAIALVVAVTGIYGVLAYHVNQQRRETAIRRALGAPAARVAGTVIGAGLQLTVGGIVVGLGGGFALGRTLAGVLYGVQPNDPAVFAAAAGILGMAALGACAVPAIRAIRIDPVSILREE